MMTAEHSKPFAAFLLVFAFACVVMANGLRDQVVQVFVASGAPRPLISAVVPDIVLGESLRNLPPARPSTPPENASVATAAEVVPSQSQPLAPRTVTVTASSVAPVDRTPTRPHRGGHPTAHAALVKPVKAAASPAPTAPVHVAPVATPSKPATPTTPQAGHGVRPTGNTGSQGFAAGGSNSGSGVDSHGSQHSSGTVHHSDHGHGQPPVRGVRGDGVQGVSGNADGGHPGRGADHGVSNVSGDHGTPGHDHGNRGDHGSWGDHGNRGDAGNHGNHGNRGNRGDHGNWGGHDNRGAGRGNHGDRIRSDHGNRGDHGTWGGHGGHGH